MENLTGIGNALIAGGQQYRRSMRDEQEYQRKLAENAEDRAFQKGQRDHLQWQQGMQRSLVDEESRGLAADALTFADESIDPFQGIENELRSFGAWVDQQNDEQVGSIVPTGVQQRQGMRAPAAMVSGGKATEQSRSAAAGMVPEKQSTSSGKPAAGPVRAGTPGRTPMGYGSALSDGLQQQVESGRKQYQKLRAQVAKEIGAPPEDPAERAKWETRAAAIWRRYAPKAGAIEKTVSEALNTMHTTKALHSMGKMVGRITSLPWDNPEAYKVEVETLIKENPGNPYLTMLRSAKVKDINLDPSGKVPQMMRVIDFGGGLMVDPAEMVSLATGAITPDKLHELGKNLYDRMAKFGTSRANSSESTAARVTIAMDREKPENTEQTRQRLATEAQQRLKDGWNRLNQLDPNLKNEFAKAGWDWTPPANAPSEFHDVVADMRDANTQYQNYRPVLAKNAGVEVRKEAVENKNNVVLSSQDQKKQSEHERDAVAGLVSGFGPSRKLVKKPAFGAVASLIRTAPNPKRAFDEAIAKAPEYAEAIRAAIPELSQNTPSAPGSKSPDTGTAQPKPEPKRLAKT